MSQKQNDRPRHGTAVCKNVHAAKLNFAHHSQIRPKIQGRQPRHPFAETALSAAFARALARKAAQA
jgi:hypothetical protein